MAREYEPFTSGAGRVVSKAEPMKPARDTDYPHVHLVIALFGSWKNALTAAGLR